MDYGILTTRFTNETYMENKRWREINNHEGCIYMSKKKVAETLSYHKPYFVLEMNNSTNKVMGIGIISIKFTCQREKIYTNYYYNRYLYKGKQHISLENIEDDEFKKLFEIPLFYGKGHMKRGQAMTHFPYKKMTTQHIDCLKRLMKIEMKKNNKNDNKNDNKDDL